jgi:hypothetical protein
MKLSALSPKIALAVTGFAVALTAGCLWFFASSGSAPDDALLTRRMNAAINLGWGWLRAEDVRVVAREKKGGKYAVTFSYSVVIDKDEDELPPEERERFREFLPMCSHLPVAKGTACPLRETMLFADTKEYGWMPDLFIHYRPEMLQAIADWQEPAAQ